MWHFIEMTWLNSWLCSRVVFCFVFPCALTCNKENIVPKLSCYKGEELSFDVYPAELFHSRGCKTLLNSPLPTPKNLGKKVCTKDSSNIIITATSF